MPDFPRKTWFYIAGIVVLGIGLAIWQLWSIELSKTFVLAWVILSLLDLICELYEVEIIHGHRTSAAIAIGAGAVLIGGTKLGLLIVLTGTLIAEIFLRRSMWRKDPLHYLAVVGFNVSQLLISIAIGGLAFQVLGGKPPPYSSLTDFLRAILLFGIFMTANAAIVAGVVHFSRGVN
ncbi:MAG: hypothetical protein ACP5LJ_07930, partial [Candidatus Bipolaricaulaceae bacterium]